MAKNNVIKNETKLKTKVARGIEYGDVSNTAIRNILTQISKSLFGQITNDDLWDSLNYFDGKCPYTGIKIDLSQENKNYSVDHIVPQNREHCGLNAKGNLLIVHKKANQQKASKSVEEFMFSDCDCLKGVDEKTRKKRLEKIRNYQKECGYQANEIKDIIQPYLNNYYSQVQKDQQNRKDNILKALRDSKKIVQSNDTQAKKLETTYKQEKISRLVQNELIPLLEQGNASHKEIESFLSKEKSKTLFDINYSLLIDCDKTRGRRYYKKPIVVYGKQYYICNHWFENSRDLLLDWIKKHKK